MTQLLATYLFLAIEICIIHSIANERQRRRTYFIVLFLQFFIFAGFRGLEIHNDTLPYASHFSNVSYNGHSWEIEKELFNPGYLILEKFIHNNITDTVLGFDIVTSFIICFCTFLLFYKKARHMGVAIFLFYVSGEYFGQVAVLREAFAVVVGYMCIYFMEKKKYLFAVLFSLLAISFHNSGFILLFLLLLDRFSTPNKPRILLFFAVVVVAYLIAPVMEFVLNLLSFETKYFAEGVDRGFSSLNGIFNGTIGILVSIGIYAMFKNVRDYSMPNIYHNILYIYFLISIVTLRLPILSRYLMYFSPFLFILVSNLVFQSKKNIKYAIIVALAFASNIIIKQWMRPDWISIFPYEFFNSRQLGLLLY